MNGLRDCGLGLSYRREGGKKPRKAYTEIDCLFFLLIHSRKERHIYNSEFPRQMVIAECETIVLAP